MVLRHDIKDPGTVSEAFPHLILEQFNSKLGQRISRALKFLFPVPKPDSKRVMTFANQNDFISFRFFLLSSVVNDDGGGGDRHHVFVKATHKEIELAEVGPRFEMRRNLRIIINACSIFSL